MKRLHQITFALVTFFCATSAMSVVTPQGLQKGSVSKATELSQSYTWYEGGTAHQVWLNPGLVAEFNPSTKGAKAVKSVSPAATQLSSQSVRGGIRIWNLDNGAAVSARSFSVAHPSGAYSPVFHDDATDSGRMRALPGNVIVTLNPDWNAAAVNDWLAKRKLKSLKKLNNGKNVFLIQSAPGLDALNLANELQSSGEVVSASPDWWKEVSHR
jgi:hypothetical protein